MTRKAKKDISTDWMDRETLENVSAFTRGGGLDYALSDAWSLSDWGVFSEEGYKRISYEYDECVIPFHDFLFSLKGFCLAFNDFEINVMNHLMTAPMQLHSMSREFVKKNQHWCEYQGVGWV